ncbi:MAG: hypothetical protein VKS61_09930 [Candidatus Sericytochromatia bacterium]|nr:hypothetical protein [Candidatus Sericytochromatia bacterium]
MGFIRLIAPTLAALGAATGAVASPAGPAPKPATATCSGAKLGVTAVVALKAPKPVQRMHRAIMAAARDCDFERLERLGREGRPGFSFTFGGDRSAAALWRGQERAGGRFAERLIRLLRLDFGRSGSTWVWPAAFSQTATEADWEALLPIFGRAQVVTWRDYEGYTGLRVGIAADGDWLYAIEGD